jgi:LysR family transcriptional regulator, glycine cleavage system transcriptional activator
MARPLGRLPPLNALRAFVATAKHLSFARGAADLYVTPAAVSQQVRILEEHLGAVLFKRANRSLLLTDEGQALLPALVDGFEKLSEALDALENVGSTGVLTVSMAPSFAAKWLVPRLESFQSTHPDIDVRVTASMHLVDFEAEGVDCAIRYGLGQYRGLLVQKLLTESVVPVCSPSIRRDGPGTSPADALREMTLLHDDSPEQDASCPSWRMSLRAAGIEAVDAERGLHFNQASLVLEAASAGRGVALAKSRLAADDLRNGRLVQLFDVAQPVDFAYWFVCPPTKATLRKVALFRDWIVREADADANGGVGVVSGQTAGPAR